MGITNFVTKSLLRNQLKNELFALIFEASFNPERPKSRYRNLRKCLLLSIKEQTINSNNHHTKELYLFIFRGV